jgi:hypothetical protein
MFNQRHQVLSGWEKNGSKIYVMQNIGNVFHEEATDNRLGIEIVLSKRHK